MITTYLLIGDSQIAVHIEKCDRLRITVDFAALLMTRPGGAHSNISMKVRNTIQRDFLFQIYLLYVVNISNIIEYLR